MWVLWDLFLMIDLVYEIHPSLHQLLHEGLFLFLYSILLHGYTSIYLLIFTANRHFDCSHLSSSINTDSINILTHAFAEINTYVCCTCKIAWSQALQVAWPT